MRKVEVTINIDTGGRNVISAFTDLEMLREWWNVERGIIEKKAGGLYTLAWSISDLGFGFVSTGIIKEYEPDSLLVIEKLVYLNPARSFLGPMKLTARASPKGDFTELYLCQDGYQEGGDWDWYYEQVRTAWPGVAETLKAYLEKKNKED